MEAWGLERWQGTQRERDPVSNRGRRSLRLVVVWGLGGRGLEEEAGVPAVSRRRQRRQSPPGGCPAPPAPPAAVVPGAQQSPSVAMATSISLLPISSKALARLLRSPSSCCSASQRSRITPVGLALVAK